MESLVLKVQGMSCSSCVSKIEGRLSKLENVSSVKVNFATGSVNLLLKGDRGGLEEVERLLSDMGYSTKNNVDDLSQGGSALIVACLCSFPLVFQELWVLFGKSVFIPGWGQLILATIVQFYVGWGFYLKAWDAVKCFSGNMFLLVMLGTSAAFFYSCVVEIFNLHKEQYFDTSAVIITLVFLGHWLEDRTKGKASEAIKEMIAIQPTTAWVMNNDSFEEVSVNLLKKDQLFMVKPGGKVPVDGEVVEGESYIDESLMTGESVPVLKKKESVLIAGSINQQGTLKARALHVGQETMIAKMVQLVERAQSSKVPAQRLADQVSKVFVPIVLFIALFTFIFWWIFGSVFSEALVNGIAVLVIACPCALGLATPIVLVVATGLGAKSGVLFQNAKAMQEAGKLERIVCDKTGTLTEGKPRVISLKVIVGDSESAVINKVMGVAELSEHPMARALVVFCKEKKGKALPVKEFKSTSGKGVTAKVQGEKIILGSLRFLKENGVTCSVTEDSETCVACAIDGVLSTIFMISDPLRKSSKEAIKLLSLMGLNSYLLTGDSNKAAEKVVKELHIEGYRAEVLPHEKVEVIEGFKKIGKTAMVGDGVNDAPALALADVGFAMRSGTDIAAASADITLMRSDLLGVVDAISLSRATVRKFHQNLFFAFIYNSVGICIAVAGLLNPMVAGGAMALSSISVVSNALLLKRWSSICR
jgi:P-type Cu+ transporter